MACMPFHDGLTYRWIAPRSPAMGAQRIVTMTFQIKRTIFSQLNKLNNCWSSCGLRTHFFNGASQGTLHHRHVFSSLPTVAWSLSTFTTTKLLSYCHYASANFHFTHWEFMYARLPEQKKKRKKENGKCRELASTK